MADTNPPPDERLLPCNMCDQTLPAIRFSRSTNARGRNGRCKDCDRVYMAARALAIRRLICQYRPSYDRLFRDARLEKGLPR